MHKVKCYYCGQSFDRDKMPFVQVSKARYAHIECSQAKQKELAQIEKDKNELEEYIKKLLNLEYINPRIRKQINQYIEEYHYTYSGILKSLIYFYEIKKNPIDKANGGIGIVPYCYEQSYRYYRALWEAQQRNQGKVIEDYAPKIVEVIIPPPKVSIRKRKKFAFLDEEEL